MGALGTGGYGKSAQTSSVSQSITEGESKHRFHTATRRNKTVTRQRQQAVEDQLQSIASEQRTQAKAWEWQAQAFPFVELVMARKRLVILQKRDRKKVVLIHACLSFRTGKGYLRTLCWP